MIAELDAKRHEIEEQKAVVLAKEDLIANAVVTMASNENRIEEAEAEVTEIDDRWDDIDFELNENYMLLAMYNWLLETDYDGRRQEFIDQSYFGTDEFDYGFARSLHLQSESEPGVYNEDFEKNMRQLVNVMFPTTLERINAMHAEVSVLGPRYHSLKDEIDTLDAEKRTLQFDTFEDNYCHFYEWNVEKAKLRGMEFRLKNRIELYSRMVA